MFTIPSPLYRQHFLPEALLLLLLLLRSHRTRGRLSFPQGSGDQIPQLAKAPEPPLSPAYPCRAADPRRLAPAAASGRRRRRRARESRVSPPGETIASDKICPLPDSVDPKCSESKGWLQDTGGWLNPWSPYNWASAP